MRFAVSLVLSFGIVFLTIPFFRGLAVKTGFVDRPAKRKIHREPVPLLGGVSIYIACMASTLILNGWTATTFAIVTGGSALVLIGLADDFFKGRGLEFPVFPRILVYLITASVPIWFGIEIIGISHFPGHGMVIFPTWLAWLATIAWVFGLTNMINFIDGVDGLAAGIVSISSLTLLVYALLRHQEETAVLAAVLAGACLAFLTFNFHPAKIFLGDAGAIFLGYTISVIAVNGAYKGATFVSLMVPMLALGVPILDTMIVFTRRFAEGKGLHRADKLHTHHTLMKWGLTQTQTVSFMYLIGLLFSLLAIILMLAFSR